MKMAVHRFSGLFFMRRLLHAAVVLLFLASFTPDNFVLHSSLNFTDARFTTDKLGNVFVITENQLLQFDSIGKPKANYFDRSSGALITVDVSNPLKILLFYRDFAKLQLLNNKLALQSTIDLRNTGILQPWAVCQSAQDGYWIYDRQDFALKKMDLNLQVVLQSGDLNQVTGYAVLPSAMAEADQWVYLSNPETGILVFDRYGSYYKTIPIPGIMSFQIIGQDLLYVKDNRLMKFNLKSISENEVLLPVHDSLVDARFEQQQLFLLTTGSLHFYSY